MNTCSCIDYLPKLKKVTILTQIKVKDVYGLRYDLVL
jgi:hypothetical protein